LTHFRWAEKAGIDVFICSWWGINSFEDKVFRRMLNIAEDHDLKVKLTIYYETLGLAENVGKVCRELAYIVKEYGGSRAFLKLNNTPVVFIYAVESRDVSFWEAVLKGLWREDIKVILIADTTKEAYAKIFHGIHIYNPLPLLLADKSGDTLRTTYKRMADMAKKYNCIFVATVMPGYDDRIIRKPGLFLEREGGRIYNMTWEIAIESGAEWIVVTSWNEWHEGTEIEPSVEYGFQYLNMTARWVEEFKKS